MNVIDSLLELDRAEPVFALLFSFAHDRSFSDELSDGFQSALNDIFGGYKLSPQVNEKLARIYKSQVESPRELVHAIEDVRKAFSENREVLLTLLTLVLRLIADDGLMSRRHAADLKQLLIGLRVTEEEFETFSSEEQVLISYALSGNTLKEWGLGTKELNACYALLTCTPLATDKEIRTAYRRLAMKFHPDRFAAQGLDKKLQGDYAKRFKEIKNAYETVRFSRLGKK